MDLGESDYDNLKKKIFDLQNQLRSFYSGNVHKEQLNCVEYQNTPTKSVQRRPPFKDTGDSPENMSDPNGTGYLLNSRESPKNLNSILIHSNYGFGDISNTSRDISSNRKPKKDSPGRSIRF